MAWGAFMSASILTGESNLEGPRKELLLCYPGDSPTYVRKMEEDLPFSEAIILSWIAPQEADPGYVIGRGIVLSS